MMNKSMINFARKEIKKGLALLPESNISLFKRMYSPTNLDISISEIVDNMPEDKLSWALTQVENTRNEKEVKDG